MYPLPSLLTLNQKTFCGNMSKVYFFMKVRRPLWAPVKVYFRKTFEVTFFETQCSFFLEFSRTFLALSCEEVKADSLAITKFV